MTSRLVGRGIFGTTRWRFLSRWLPDISRIAAVWGQFAAAAAEDLPYMSQVRQLHPHPALHPFTPFPEDVSEPMPRHLAHATSV